MAASMGLPTDSVLAREPAPSAASRQAKAAYPKAPRAGYSPRHVRQLMSNCAFASAEMLIDKWTEGRRPAPQQLLRRATGIPTEDGGPTLSELRRAVARVSGIDMRWSPNGGDPLTWQELLLRLEDGGGALVNVWPAKLPAHYRRWIPSLTTGHSVYVERYDHARQRIWLMDPLGRGTGFRGEWIDADVLYRAMWHSGRYVWAAATPAPLEPRTPALSDFQLQAPEIPPAAYSDDSISISISYRPLRLGATLPQLHVAAEWEPMAVEAPEPEPEAVDPAGQLGEGDHVALSTVLEPGLPDGLEVAAVSVDEDVEASPAPGSVPVTVSPKVLQANVPTPSRPGEYLLRLALPGAANAPTFAPVAVRIRGPLAGRMVGGEGPATVVREGDLLTLEVKVRNLGSSDWGPDGESVALTAAFDGDPFGFEQPLEVAAGDVVVVPLALRVQTHPGIRPLRLALVDGRGRPIPESDALEVIVEVAAADTRLAGLR
jgi:hypothetical protein